MMARLSSFRQLVSTPALMILAAAACASAKVTSSRGSAMLKVFLLTFFQESLKRFLANIARKSKKDKKAKEK